jgi:hypothetical protein
VSTGAGLRPAAPRPRPSSSCSAAAARVEPGERLLRWRRRRRWGGFFAVTGAQARRSLARAPPARREVAPVKAAGGGLSAVGGNGFLS